MEDMIIGKIVQLTTNGYTQTDIMKMLEKAKVPKRPEKRKLWEMREIKFRCWHKEEKVMYDVGELHWCQGGIRFYGLGVGKGWVDEDVDLMQFTGLKDKNGREIFEGDIVLDSGYYGIVTYGDYRELSACFYMATGKFGTPWDGLLLRKICEVIGNIYENPDLCPK